MSEGWNFCAVKDTPLRWLEPQAIAARAFPKNQIDKVKYFTAKVENRPGDPNQRFQQTIYWRALRTIPGRNHQRRLPNAARASRGGHPTTDSRARVQETKVTADALLPDGPYDLWQDGDTVQRVKNLAGAFASFPHLPKMLNTSAIIETLVDGRLAGDFVLLENVSDAFH